MATRTGWVWAGLSTSVALALVVVAVPVWHIRPFRPQTPEGMALSYGLRQLGPALTVVTLLTSAACAALLFGRTRGWRRGMAVALVAPAVIAAWFARQNHFEWMFNPLPDPGYAQAAEVTFLEPGDLVLGVDVGGESVAYPVRLLAYHHVVNDVVGGTPMTATY